MLKDIDFFKKDITVGIFGFGISGQSVFKWCNSKNINTIIFDDAKENCENFSEEKIKLCSLIIRSPSFLNDNKWVRFANACGIFCINDLDLAAFFWKGKIIAVTGTDGKTTTTEFLAFALKKTGFQTVSVGNNGTPLMEYITSDKNHKDSIAVIEVSSFQAEALKYLHPDYVLWINFAHDHLNKHGSLENYFRAKYNLIHLCKDPDIKHVFVGESVVNYSKQKAEFSLISEQNVHTKIEYLPCKSPLNISVQRENYAIVEALYKNLNLPIKYLENAAIEFKLPKHRLQKIATLMTKKKDGVVEFWNDSKATNFHSFQAAVNTFNKKLILILGGKSKGEALDQYIDEICKHAKSVFLLGETGRQIYEELQKKNIKNGFCSMFFYPTNNQNPEKILSKIVNDIFCVALPEDIVLFSPGFSSFDMFENFEERGNLYEKCVFKLSHCDGFLK